MIYIDDRLDLFDLDASLSLLSDERRERVMRYRNEGDRKRSAAAYILLCKALSEEYGIEEKPLFAYGEHGKPIIVGHEEIHFNLSHCRQAAVCVLSDEEIGVDIEEIRRFRPSLVDYTMNDAQRQMIAAAEHPEVEFIRLWTMKEALLKLTGLGLRTDLKTLDLSGYRFTTRVETQKGYVCTVCQK